MQHFKDYSLKDHNTLKIDVSCDNYYLVENANELQGLQHVFISDENRFLLGMGANTLFSGDFKGNVIHLATNEIRVIDQSDTDVTLEVDAGTDWHTLVTYTVENNWGGIENMALIPGSVGAAAVGNIAAYNQVFSDTCVRLSVYEYQSGRIKILEASECGFSYRNSLFKSAFKDTYLIVSVVMKLKKDPIINTEYWSKKHGTIEDELKKTATPPFTIADVYKTIVRMRTEKFPDMNQLGTAGSFFKNPFVTQKELEAIKVLLPDVQYYPITGMHYIKNPDETLSTEELVKVSAGDILDNGMGYKGMWIGNVGLFEKHALTLVTNGRATGHEVVAFSEKIEKDFYDYCGVHLEREVITI